MSLLGVRTTYFPSQIQFFNHPFPEFYGKITEDEFRLDLVDRMKKGPRFSCKWFFFLMLPVIGWIVLICASISFNKKENKYQKMVVDDFHTKYEKLRGISAEMKGATIEFVVMQPGFVLPGVEPFPLSREAFMIVQGLIRGVRPPPNVSLEDAQVMTAPPTSRQMFAAPAAGATATTTTTSMPAGMPPDPSIGYIPGSAYPM